MFSTKVKSFIALLLVVNFWGLAFPAVSHVMLSGIAVGTLNVFRFGIAFLVLLPFFAKDLKNIKKQDLLNSLFCGLLLFGGFFFITLALQQEESSPGVSALIVGMGIFITPLLSYFIFKKKMSFVSIIGVVVAFVGIFFFGYTGTLNFNFTLSNLYSLLSAILFGVHLFVLVFVMKNSNTKILTILQLLIVFLLFLIYVLIFEPSTLQFNFNLFTWVEIVYLAVFGAGLAYFFQTYASKYLPANVCNILLGLESLSAVIFSIILGMDKVTTFYVIGTVLILFGTLTVIREENKYNQLL